jgi:Cyclin, N-terminal domain
MNMEATLETIAAMRHQEDTGYQTRDFLAQHEGLLPDVDADCRTKMAAWCYQVVDFCNFNRESVEIAMNYLDRFLLTAEGQAVLQDRTTFQLASMTTLYTAIKINEPEAVNPQTVSDLSKGCYTAQDVEAMEFHILNALQWRVNPPTAMAFVCQFLELIPEYALSKPLRATAYDIAKFQTELAVSDYDFIADKRSSVAFCSLVNALESMHLDEKVRSYIAYLLARTIGLDQDADDIRQIRACLFSAVVENEPQITATLLSTPTPQKPVSRRVSFDTSPRSTAVLRQ